ncbi:MAG TPA: GIY-YIG nuclease family protein [Candidatus Paceibacterota bacterium]
MPTGRRLGVFWLTPIKFLYQEKFKTKGEAARREKQIKGWRRKKKFNLIKFGKLIISPVVF